MKFRFALIFLILLLPLKISAQEGIQIKAGTTPESPKAGSPFNYEISVKGAAPQSVEIPGLEKHTGLVILTPLTASIEVQKAGGEEVTTHRFQVTLKAPKPGEVDLPGARIQFSDHTEKTSSHTIKILEATEPKAVKALPAAVSSEYQEFFVDNYFLTSAPPETTYQNYRFPAPVYLHYQKDKPRPARIEMSKPPVENEILFVENKTNMQLPEDEEAWEIIKEGEEQFERAKVGEIWFIPRKLGTVTLSGAEFKLWVPAEERSGVSRESAEPKWLEAEFELPGMEINSEVHPFHRAQ